MGCQYFDTSGTHTFTWPDGVTRAIVYAIGSGGGGGKVSGTGDRNGGGGGGGGALAEALVTKTDATATVVVGASAAEDTDGQESYFQQGATTNVSAAGGKKGANQTGGAGGLAADCVGAVKYSGGTGGNSASSNDGGGGGGASAGNNANGANGASVSGSTTGGAGGIGADGGHDGGDGGDEGFAGSAGDPYGGGGGGAGGNGGPGGSSGTGFVSVCWEDPVPTGYCISTGTNQAWWPRCNYYCGGLECFYYGGDYYLAPVLCDTCGTTPIPGVLYVTFFDTTGCGCDGTTIRLFVDRSTLDWSWDGIPTGCFVSLTDISDFIASCSGTYGSFVVAANMMGSGGLANAANIGECGPILMFGQFNFAGDCGNPTYFVITE